SAGDISLDPETGTIYVKDPDGTWKESGNLKGAKGDKGDAGVAGQDGKDGTTITTNIGKPSDSDGTPGDINIDPTTGTV
ncbi:TPA: hypothetical protein U0919_002291, partial [Streptococcus suis]|nr:hypothetical protein [Streptococcus suis]